MKIAGIEVHRRRRNFKLAPAWENLLAPMKRRDHDEIHRFAGWCSVLGINPQAVTPGVFENFLHHLNTEAIQANPRERWNVARRVWNRAVAPLPAKDFPTIPLNAPEGWRGLSWSAFPVSLLTEIEQYEVAVTEVDLLDDIEDTYEESRFRRPIKQVTVKGYLNNLRWHLSRLVENGEPIERFSSLEACIEPELVKHGLKFRLGSKKIDEKTTPGLHAMMISMLSIAHYLNVSDEKLTKLKRLAKTVRYRPEGMCERNIVRLAQFADGRVMHAFASLPFKIAGELADVTVPTFAQALSMQRAALLVILLHVPMRIRNVSELNLDKHIRRPVGGVPGSWLIHFEPSEVKNAVALDGQFNDRVSALLDRYIEVFRPRLMTEPTSLLFVGKASFTLSSQFSKWIKRELGLIVNVHLMRHLAAFTYLRAHPGDYETVRRFLGHKNIETTVRYYAGLNTEIAFKQYDQIITEHIVAWQQQQKPIFAPKLVPLEDMLKGLQPEDVL